MEGNPFEAALHIATGICDTILTTYPINNLTQINQRDAGINLYNETINGKIACLFINDTEIDNIIPTLYTLSSRKLPGVVFVKNIVVNPIYIAEFATVILCPKTVQETQEASLLAFTKGLTQKVPVVVFLPNVQQTWIPLDVSKLQLRNALKLSPDDSDLPLIKQTPSVLSLEEFLEGANIPVTPFRYHGPSNATKAVVVTQESAEIVNLCKENNIGVVLVKILRPWGQDAFKGVLPGSIKTLVVVDDGEWGYLSRDILSSVENSVSIVSLSSNGDLTVKVVEEALKGNLASNISKEIPPKPTPVIDSISISTKDPCIKMLLQLFRGNALWISKVVGETASWGIPRTKEDEEIVLPSNSFGYSSPEFALGLYVVESQKRERLTNAVKEVISKNQVHPEFVNALQQWLESKDNEKYANKYADIVLNKLKTTEGVPETIKELDNYFIRRSHWAVGDKDWIVPSQQRSLLNVLSSGENINILLIADDDMNSSTWATWAEIAMLSMNTGSCYVASISPYAHYTQAVNALHEADKFNGPSIVAALIPPLSSNSNDPSIDALTRANNSVDNGSWPLFRWSVSSLPRLTVDSIAAQRQRKAFQNQHLGIVGNEIGNNPSAMSLGSALHIHNVRMKAEKEAREQAGSAGPPLLILYGSETGHAESLAKRLERGAKARKLTPKCMPADEFPLEELSREQTIVFLVATSGQGEFPLNCKEIWAAARDNVINITGVNYSVFALGDSKYWPREEENKAYFCKPGKDLDKKLVELGGVRLTEIGFGDDQDEDVYETGYKKWEIELWTALNVPIDVDDVLKPPTADEIKEKSNFLRGTIAEGLKDTSTLGLSETDQLLLKFHGSYQQDDRDVREERKKNGLEKAISFMIRVRMPGGVVTPKQWIAIDELAHKYGNGTLKLTTRQAFELHGILKQDLKQTIKEINETCLTTIGACGDVVRNVMCSPNPHSIPVYETVSAFATELSNNFAPKTSGYHEIWCDQKKVAPEEPDKEPIYGPTYLPRKFKMAVVVPPINDVDIFSNDLGYIAIVENNKVIGYNVTVGGGFGMTHGNVKTYPRLADVLGFCYPDQAMLVAEKVVIVQRDFGDRKNRKHARLKYTIDDRGIEWFKEQVETLLGFPLAPAKPYHFTTMSDSVGWTQRPDGLWDLGIFVQNGDVWDWDELPLVSTLRKIAHLGTGYFRLTSNQNLAIAAIEDKHKDAVEALLVEAGIHKTKRATIQTKNGITGLQLNSMACQALPLCPLAFADASRDIPRLIQKLSVIIEESGLAHESITMRMTGCPNGCARPYNAEIGLVGKVLGRYNLYLGGGFTGERLNKLYRESLSEDEIVSALTPIIKLYAAHKLKDEHFGDFVIRNGIVKPTLSGKTFHQDIENVIEFVI